jgi:hypothetical protein
MLVVLMEDVVHLMLANAIGIGCQMTVQNVRSIKAIYFPHLPV